MINLSNLIPTVVTRVKKMPVGHYLKCLTYKKDRSVVVVKTGVDILLLIEDGYESLELEISPGKLKKTLKGIIKKEFPRSKMVHLQSGTWLDGDGRCNSTVKAGAPTV